MRNSGRLYRMTRATFGVSASSLAANKQIAVELVWKYPLAADVVRKSFYVDEH